MKLKSRLFIFIATLMGLICIVVVFPTQASMQEIQNVEIPIVQTVAGEQKRPFTVVYELIATSNGENISWKNGQNGYHISLSNNESKTIRFNSNDISFKQEGNYQLLLKPISYTETPINLDSSGYQINLEVKKFESGYQISQVTVRKIGKDDKASMISYHYQLSITQADINQEPSKEKEVKKKTLGFLPQMGDRETQILVILGLIVCLVVLVNIVCIRKISKK
ncbi:hypothetical protein GKC33_05750 [Lactobacillus salivarius]|uniref:Uncharacterized protein n=1 Tax=Ligilactobacillus salivarius TaxID=1624 RepID=A0A6A8LN88_9LACO|nr:hypothetical protein [Ligilactobacillus salivarius]MSE08231.1 hypothetical protein [Ligilactobacillus salivarius]